MYDHCQVSDKGPLLAISTFECEGNLYVNTPLHKSIFNFPQWSNVAYQKLFKKNIKLVIEVSCTSDCVTLN